MASGERLLSTAGHIANDEQLAYVEKRWTIALSNSRQEGPMIDTPAYARQVTQAGVPHEQAEAMAEALKAASR